jgi:DNA-directed RNA polymerase specialized sigma24 family protein
VDALVEAQEIRELIGRCLAGDREATTRFQQTYGELIYGFPMRAYRTPEGDAGDFYVFAFDGGRIFRRLRTFQGRAPFRAYLLGSVLDHLVLEWKRGQRDIDTVSIDDIPEISDGDEQRAGAPLSSQSLALGAPPPFTDEDRDPMEDDVLRRLLEGIDVSKALVLKLLHVEDHELTAPEIRYIAATSGRSAGEVLTEVERLRASVQEREASAKRVEDALDAVQAWTQLYERRLRRIAEDLTALPPTSTAASRLREEQTELEQKIQRRQQQRAKLLLRRQRRKVTAPYKEIAALLNTSVGNVGSQIARLRQELQARARNAAAANQGLGIGEKND